MEALKALARQRLAGGQGELDLGVDTDALAAGGAGPLQIASSHMTLLWQALRVVYAQLGFDTATDDDDGRAPGARADHRADQQVRQPARAGRGRDP